MLLGEFEYGTLVEIYIFISTDYTNSRVGEVITAVGGAQ